MKKNTWQKNIGKELFGREYVCEKLQENNIKGVAGLIYIKKVTSPCIKEHEEGKKIKIADNNYYWLQIGIEGKNFWITAMYNDKKELIQYYIDITKKNVINDEPYFYDLFLDIVVSSSGKCILLDEDELKNALDEKIINHKEYEFAYAEAKRIIENIPNNKENLDSLCRKYFNILLKKMKK